MNTATPGTELPLAGMTTEMFGQGFTFHMEARPHNARCDRKHGNLYLVCASLTVGLVTHDVYILCDNVEDQQNVVVFINNYASRLCTLQVGHHHDGLVFYWIRLNGFGNKQYAIRSAV